MSITGTYIGDVHKFETFDGLTLEFGGTAQFFRAYGNYGAPPTTFQTRRGYRQDGVTELTFNLEPRSVQISIYFPNLCSRQEYWDKRAEISNFFRPNRGGPLTLTLIQPDGTKRSLDVRADAGFTFPPLPTETNAWNIDEVVTFTAFNPLWYDPADSETAIAYLADQHLVFPITFPIQFGAGGFTFETSITYAGTWKAYPVITITGPYSTAIIRNAATGARIGMGVSVATGHTRIIDLTQGAQSIVDQNGVDRFGELSDFSDLVNWYIAPAPEAAGGVNTIVGLFTDAVNPTTTLTVSFNARYFGV